ncbi:histidine phosphatase family protein [Telmatospirillum sp.]|uniref:SixA phosphatase family protein n=1 Tax=Telmatospirillum sp. TaxID=2079197 RepID=UPI0028407142|nr:histidine phosphatase family protein [Telmatospirillum sp.]MDR3438441.1 histidine phosphatase family protein [Telmatospirillum sp.]
MKLLYLLRHAKSSWDDPDIDDFDRPLNRRGRETATLVADYCRDHEIQPSTIICSTAKRTRQTLQPWLSALDNVPVNFDNRVYEASWKTLYALINDLHDGHRTALLLGHNPGLQRLALQLAHPDSDNPALPRMAAKLPTGSLIVLSSTVDRWAEITPGSCEVVQFLRPADIGGADD